MKNLTFGIEIELTGISRKIAAEAVAGYFGTRAYHAGGGYDKWEAADDQGRRWLIVNDSSISPEMRHGGRKTVAGLDYRVELVSPVCTYRDVETVQELTRVLRKAGGLVNKTCAIHLHVGKDRFSAGTLRNLVNIIASKEELIYRALAVDRDREYRYCHKVKQSFLNDLNRKKPKGLEELADIWYKDYDSSRSRKYHPSRYHGLNLHSVFHGPTVEYRFFNGTLHAGKIKAYIQFCLAICCQALSQKSASAKKTQTTNPKYTFRTWLLRLGLIGKEFETARLHLLANLEGDSAFRYGRQAAGF